MRTTITHKMLLWVVFINKVVLDNPTCFTNPFQFEITFECLQELDDDLEWKVLYVGSAQDASRDQILDEILVGPVPVGTNKFVLQADAPDPSKLAPEDLLGVTVVLVTCSYKEREFVRVGYYVNNEYHNPDAPPLPPPGLAAADGDGGQSSDEPPPTPPPLPNPIPLEHIQRQILADKPRVTKFPISWGDEETMADHVPPIADTSGGGTLDDSTHAPLPNTITPPGMLNSQHIGASSMMAAGSLLSSGLDSGIVSMQEESNMSHSHFGVQAMTE
jgi:histone chaperone ASF1